VDQLVCNALADSLLALSKDLLAAAAAAVEDSETTVGSIDDADVFGTMSALGLLPVAPPSTPSRRRAQADRLFAGYPAVRELSALVLRVAAARRYAVPAAVVVVVEQLGARGVLPGDGELFRRALDVMHACGA